MFTINPEAPKIVNVLDPHFDMTDGLSLRQNSITDRRGSVMEPQCKKLETVILTNEEQNYRAEYFKVIPAHTENLNFNEVKSDDVCSNDSVLNKI